MKVKICGITSAEDIKIVNACKPDFAGFVMFFPKSKRNISPETAKSLIETLDKNVLSVAVTVSPTLEQVKTAYDCGFDYIQIHGEVGEDVLSNPYLKVIRAFNVSDLEKFDDLFTDYYENEFIVPKDATSFTPYAKKSIDFIKKNGGRLIAATNPIFPFVATKRRLEWAGVSPDDFELVTTYENFGCCKPNLKYFEEICKKQDIKPEDSIMIGNDVDEDLCSAKLGFDTYLITDTIVNRDNKDYSDYKNGSFEEFYKDFLKGD